MFDKIYVPKEPLCVDDYVVLKYEGREIVVLEYPDIGDTWEEWAGTKDNFLYNYRPIELKDTEAVERVQRDFA